MCEKHEPNFFCSDIFRVSTIVKQESRAAPNSFMVLKGKKIINEFLRYFLRQTNCLKSFLQAFSIVLLAFAISS